MHVAALATRDALADSGLEQDEITNDRCGVSFGSTAGSIGIVIAELLERRRAGRIALVDIVPSHLETAAPLGNFEAFLTDDREGVTAELAALEAAVWFECAGGISPTLDIAIEAAPRGARVVLVSQRPEGAWINYQWVMGKELTLQGSAGHLPEEFAEALARIATGGSEDV